MVTENKNGWCDPYPIERSTLNSKPVSESPVFATQVIDGKGYRIATPPDGKEGLMRTYCIGPVKVVEGKAVILEKSEKPVTDTPPASISQAWNIDVQSFVTKSPTDSTQTEDVTHEKQTFVTTGRPKADLPVDEIMELHGKRKSSRDIVKILSLNVSYRTVARIIEGQQLLDLVQHIV